MANKIHVVMDRTKNPKSVIHTGMLRALKQTTEKGKTMRLIDADKLDWWYKGRPIRRVIDEAPTIDAVPVVRCKDCKHRYFNDCFDRFCCAKRANGFEDIVSEDEFCSRGERKYND